MGTSQDLQRWQRLLLSVIVGVLVITGVVTYTLIGQLRAANQNVSYEHAERVIDADGLEIALFSRSANARGYLLTGDTLFLEQRIAARAELERRLDSLDRRHDTELLADIRKLTQRFDVESQRAIDLYAKDPEQARSAWAKGARPIQEQLAKLVGQLAFLERIAFTTARDQAASAWRSAAILLAVLLVGVSILVTSLIYGYARATRRLVARQKAEQEQTTFRLLEQVPVGIFVLSAEGAPYYANKHAQKLLGRGIIPSTVDRLAETYQAYEAGTERIYPSDRMPLARALAGEIAECTDMEIRRDDEVIPLHVVGAPVHDARGDLLYAVAGFQDVRELQRVAMRDALTGLANRTAITQIYNRERAVSARAQRPFAVALIDLDKFKSVNDTHGHAAGDEVLRRTAARVVASLRRSDAVGRWGGEELIVLLPGTDVVGASKALEHALTDVRALEFAGKGGAPFSVTFSAGVVLAATSEALDDAVARADVLLYEAKAAGRNRVLAAAA